LASIDRTAYPRFKRVVSAREVAEAFTPTPEEIVWARGKTQSDPHLLALVVRLKAYRRLDTSRLHISGGVWEGLTQLISARVG
jgi:hypothetical protein